MPDMRFPLPPDLQDLQDFRLKVRADIAVAMTGTAAERARSWTRFDDEFSRKMGAAGYIGMVWPREYGGHQRTELERFIVIEEYLASGAPVAGHWAADRQSGPLLLKYGTEAQKRDILPRIAAGECFFCIGMSEADAGSDLASVRTRCTRTAKGWVISGAKLWTSGADRCHYMILLGRTSPQTEERHKGLSQFLVDLKRPGITIRPIRSMSDDYEFNEVIFDDVLVPEDALLGRLDGGWQQVMGELGIERSGPERFMSSHRLIFEFAKGIEPESDAASHAALGRLIAGAVTLRKLSMSIAAHKEQMESLQVNAAIVKELGARFEQGAVEVVRQAVEVEPDGRAEADLDSALGITALCAPLFSLRGGTTEILRGIIARELGLR